MLYAIRLDTPGKPECYLLPACFDDMRRGTQNWSSGDMPAAARKFATAADAALCCESLYFRGKVVPLEGTRREYPPPQPAPASPLGPPTSGHAVAAMPPANGNGKGKADGEAR